MRRIGRSQDALEVYGGLLAAQPYSASARLGRAATFIELKAFASAEELLDHPNTPKSLVDWRKHFLMALLYQARNDQRKCKTMLEFGMRKTPIC